MFSGAYSETWVYVLDHTMSVVDYSLQIITQIQVHERQEYKTVQIPDNLKSK